jgi:RNA polymerase sigma factor (sigma-70 family)
MMAGAISRTLARGGYRHMKPKDRGGFVTTRWSLVVAAAARTKASDEALATLCQTYWYALYAYVRRCGYNVEQAEDLVQGFFLRFLDRDILLRAQPGRGRFRSLLLASLKHFMLNEHDRARAAKRGGGVPLLALDISAAEGRYALEPRDALNPERLFERRWALTMVQRAHVRLRSACVRSGRARLYEQLDRYVAGDDEGVPYREAAAVLNMTEGAVRVAVHRLRRKFQDLLREEIAQTVEDSAEIDEELQFLLRTLADTASQRGA